MWVGYSSRIHATSLVTQQPPGMKLGWVLMLSSFCVSWYMSLLLRKVSTLQSTYIKTVQIIHLADLIVVYRPLRQFFNHTESLPLSVKGILVMEHWGFIYCYKVIFQDLDLEHLQLLPRVLKWKCCLGIVAG